MPLYSYLQQWLRQKHAATAIEYGMIAAGIALTIAGTVFAFGDQLYAMYFSDLAGALNGP
jgi:Flp pilus assembly pilin Flp